MLWSRKCQKSRLSSNMWTWKSYYTSISPVNIIFSCLKVSPIFSDGKKLQAESRTKRDEKVLQWGKKRSRSLGEVRVWYFNVTSRFNPRFPCVTKTFVTIVWVGAFWPFNQSELGTRGTIMKEGERKQNNISTPFHWECVCVFVREVTVRDWN